MLYNYESRNRLQNVYSDKSADGDSLKLEATYTYFNDNQINTETMIITPLDLKLDSMTVSTQKKYSGQKTVTAGRVNIQPNVKVVFAAEKKITLKPGFHAKNGSDFSTKLDALQDGDLDKLTVTNVYDSNRGFLRSKTNNYSKVGVTGTANTGIFYQGLNYLNNGNVSSQSMRNNPVKVSWPALNFSYTYDDYSRIFF